MTASQFSQVLVMPAHRETASDVIECIESYLACAQSELGFPVIVIIVLNDRNLEQATEAKAVTDWCAASSAQALGLNDPWTLGQRLGHSILIWQGLDALFLFDEKSGVGRARRIGSDAAAQLIDSGHVICPWIRAIDADSRAPAQFFKSIERLKSQVGLATYPFWHEPASEAAIIYELSLRYYLLGLSWASSPWAYQSVGSSQVVHVESYKKVRGYPNLLAGEDFHLAAKVAKTAPIIRLNKTEPIKLSGRQSSRVPFGTGVGVTRIQVNLQQQVEPTFYNPKCFQALRVINQNLNEVVASQSPRALSSNKPEALSSDIWAEVLKTSGLGIESIQRCLSSSPNRSSQLKSLRNQFDALNTLHCVHALESAVFKAQPWSVALSDASWLNIQDATLARQKLFQLEDELTELIHSASS